MTRGSFDPTPEQQNVFLVGAATLKEAELLIESCEHGDPDGVEIRSITFSIATPAQNLA